MSPEDARNFLLGRAPKGAEPNRYDWKARTYTARRQKTSTYYEAVPIPQPVYDLVFPYVRAGRGAPKLPWKFPIADERYLWWHKLLEQAAGVKTIKRRVLNAYRHHFPSTLPELGAPKMVRKVLAAQKTEKRERLDILENYEHAHADLLDEWSDRFVAHVQAAMRKVDGEAA